jgi:hypothetical protein
MDMTASLDVTTRAIDHCPEWMREQIEESSRSFDKEAEQMAPSERLLGTAENEPEEPVH